MLKKALLLIEFQNEWLDPRGKLYPLMQDTEQFHQSINNAAQVLNHTRCAGDKLIMHSGLSFPQDYLPLGRHAQSGLRQRIVARQTFQQDSFASEFTPKFQPQHNETTISGRVGSSAFAGSNLDCILRNNQIEELYIMGYALHVCVESTMRQAHDLGYNVTLLSDASAAFTATQQDHVLTHVVPHFANSITTKEYINVAN